MLFFTLATAFMAAQPTLDRKTYWRRQLRRIVVLLIIWAVVGFGMGILFVEQLNTFTLGGMPFGFWMAQQGSIYVFVVLILVYAILSDKADREAGLAETDATTASTSSASH